MSRFNPAHNAPPILEASKRWAAQCLRSDGSILSNIGNLWTVDGLNELDRAFVQNLDMGDGSFYEKLEAQLSDASPESRCLMAEALWALMLFQSNIGVEKKRENIVSVWNWSGFELDPGQPMLSEMVLKGLGSSGAAYNTQRWRELAFLITSIRGLKGKEVGERGDLLSDPWQFAAWLDSLPDARRRQFRHIWLHLLFPDQFERISSSADKRKILAAFNRFQERDLKKWDDGRIDRTLLDTRVRLEEETGGPIDFYQEGIAERWRDSAKSWLLSWNPTYWPWPSLQIDRASAARGAPITQQWRCSSLQPTEGDQAFLVKVGDPPRGIVAAGTIVRAPYEAPHYDAIKAQAGQMASFVDVEFREVRDAAQDAIVTTDTLTKAQPAQTWSPQGSGIQIETAAANALSLMWKALPPINDLPREEQLTTRVIVGARNLILYGPPGTGKTHRLQSSYIPSYEERLASGKIIKRYEFVTFHQSYAYEDFIEGIRPTVKGGAVIYDVLPGVLKRLCERARLDPLHRYAMFIDEINRGNVAKVFGELITLLEPDKRVVYDENGRFVSGLELTLPYSGKQFGVPSNLDIIATMNTADRSIALLDAALRRRFEFEELMPTPGAITGADGRGVIPDGDGGEIDLRRLLALVNQRVSHLLHRDQMIGHSYLMKVRDFPSLRRVLARELIPLLQDYFYDDWNRVRLVLADASVNAEHQLVRASPVLSNELFFGVGDETLQNRCEYSIIPEGEITPDSVRKIYEPPQ